MQVANCQRQVNSFHKSHTNTPSFLKKTPTVNTAAGSLDEQVLITPKKVRKGSYDITSQHSFLPQQCLRKTIVDKTTPILSGEDINNIFQKTISIRVVDCSGKNQTQNIYNSQTIPNKKAVSPESFKNDVSSASVQRCFQGQESITDSFSQGKMNETTFKKTESANPEKISKSLFKRTQSISVKCEEADIIFQDSSVKKVSIEEFSILKKLGQGQLGQVFSVYHKQTNSLYALKQIKKAKLVTQKLKQRLAMQIKLQLYFNHPNIVKLYTVFDDKEHIYLLQEYLEGGNLFNKTKKKENPQEQVSLYMADILKGIQYMHFKQVAHRDIKPQNVVISYDVCKICDFGCAAYCSENYMRSTPCGTLDYNAPQILEGQQYGPGIDQWCLGVMAYELLTGKTPFYHFSKKQTMKKIINKDHNQLQIPEHLSQFAKGFIKNLISWQPSLRANCEQCLQHPFITLYGTQE